MTHPTTQELQAQIDRLAIQLSHMRWRDLRNRPYREHPELTKAIELVALHINNPMRCQHAIDAALEDAEALCDRYQWGGV